VGALVGKSVVTFAAMLVGLRVGTVAVGFNVGNLVVFIVGAGVTFDIVVNEIVAVLPSPNLSTALTRRV
jgi:hypothetical protein